MTAKEEPKEEEKPEGERGSNEGFDVFGKKSLTVPGAARPATAKHVASIEFDFGPDVVDEIFHLHVLGDGRFELWLSRFSDKFVVARLPLPGCSEVEAGRRLLEGVYLRMAAYGHAGPLKSAGLVDEAAWAEILDSIASHTAAEDHPDPHGLIALARELGLSSGPIPGRAPLYGATCPGTHHWIEINPDRGNWYCGYCGRGGEREELRSFVVDRHSNTTTR